MTVPPLPAADAVHARRVPAQVLDREQEAEVEGRALDPPSRGGWSFSGQDGKIRSRRELPG
jgi:hypothetical protein